MSNCPIPGTQKNAEPSNSPQKPTPEGPHLAPVHHAVAGGVVTDDVLFRVVILAHDRQLLHVEAVFLKFPSACSCVSKTATTEFLLEIILLLDYVFDAAFMGRSMRRRRVRRSSHSGFHFFSACAIPS
jgi:hypothetical protein